MVGRLLLLVRHRIKSLVQAVAVVAVVGVISAVLAADGASALSPAPDEASAPSRSVVLDSAVIVSTATQALMQAQPPRPGSSVVAAGFLTCATRTDGTVACWGYNAHGQTDAPSGTFSTVIPGDRHSCGIRTDGTVACWGNNDYGQADAPSGTFVDVASAQGHSDVHAGLGHPRDYSCGIRTDGTIECWGDNTFGQLDAPGGTFGHVATGRTFSCGIRTDSTIECWGDNTNGQLDAPSGTFSTVTAGWRHSCGIRTDGTAACWGENDDAWGDHQGQADAPSGTFSAVTAGVLHSCGIRTDSTVACWGSNLRGKTDAPSGTFSAVTAGVLHSCGIRTDSTVACWGNNYYGESDAPSGTFSTVTAGFSHSCGIRTDGTITCWGNNEVGQTDAPSGRFGPQTQDPPDAAATGAASSGPAAEDTQAHPAPSTVAAGGDHSCALRTSGTVACWGDNFHGQTDAPSGTFSSVTAGRHHSCGLTTDGAVVCWGFPLVDFGQTDAPSGTFSSVAAGVDQTCAIGTDGAVVCWGRQSSAPPGTFSAVGAGDTHTCGLRTDGTIVCWGSNFRGKTDAPSGTFAAVAAGWDHSCGLRTGGTIVCWGSNTDFAGNHLGQADAPTGTFTSISAGFYHSCAIGVDATVTCWGDNDSGQTDAPTGAFSAVAAGQSHSCGLRTSGTIECWGSNYIGQADAPSGQFGPTTTDTPTADTPTVDTPTADTPTVDTPTADTPTVDTPTTDTPTPTVDTPTADTPTVDTPTADTSTGPVGGDTAVEGPAVGFVDDTTQGTGDSSVTNIEAETTEAVPGAVGALTATPVHGEGVQVRWSAPVNDGGSPVVRYEVEYSRGALAGHPVAGTTGPRRITRRVDGTSDFYEHLYTGVAYTVTVKAVNAVGSGRSASATFTVLDGPGAVRGLRATPVHGEGVQVRWSAPLNDGGSPVVGYEVVYSRGALAGHPVAGTAGPRRITRRVDGTSDFYEHLYTGVIYTVSVRAVNAVGSGPSVFAVFRVFDSPGVVGGLTATPVHGEGVQVRWSEPADDGGLPVVGYEVVYSRGALAGHPVAGTTGPRRITRRVDGTSDFYEHLYTGVAYTVTVRAVNAEGSGGSATATFTIMRPCPAGDKFETKTESAWKLWKLGRRSTWLVALQDFVTINGHEIEAGDEGGKVSDESNLSQSGCSWIFEDAEVTGDAHVSENAIVHGDARVYDRAQVYGNAEVYDEARVYDEAQVYGNAAVFGSAQVYGNARVYDQAIVHGKAQVYDTALVYERAEVFGEAKVYLGPAATIYDVNRFEHLGGQVYGEAKVYDEAKVYGYAKLFESAIFSAGMEASDGEFDGEQEYVRAGRQLYREMFAHLAAELTACDDAVGSYSENEIPEIVRNLLNEDGLIRGLSEIHVQNCLRHRTIREVLKFFSPGLTWWDVAFSVALTVTGIRGSFYLKSLIELVQASKPLLDLAKISRDIEQWKEQWNEEWREQWTEDQWKADAARVWEEFKKCEDLSRSAESCEP